MKHVYDKYGVVLDPHGAVGWKALETFLRGRHDFLSVIYETADPGKFPDDVKKAIGATPEPPLGMKKQAALKERVYSIEALPEMTSQGMGLSDGQVAEAKRKIGEIFT
jgi:threonine synthase